MNAAPQQTSDDATIRLPPVLSMTGEWASSLALTQRGATEQGIVFLPKPITPAALARKVREVLDSSL
jgi:hypothetical protein